MSSEEKLPVLRLQGDAWARGLAHGEHLRLRIAELIERWGDALEGGYGVCRRRYVDLFFEQTMFEATLARVSPQVLIEVRGIAKGAGLDYRQVLAFQHVNEEFDYAPRFAKQAPAGDPEACSTIVSVPTGRRPSLVAQNLDLAEFLDGFQYVVRTSSGRGDGEIMMLTVPGMISLMGMNSHGFAICDNALTQLRTDPHGVPILRSIGFSWNAPLSARQSPGSIVCPMPSG